MQFKNIANKLIKLKEADLKLRANLVEEQVLGNEYNKEMEALHRENADALEKIIDTIGYPTISKVGKEASEAAWLIIQHAIAKPEFMKKCLLLLERFDESQDVDPKNIAYLSDRINVFEGRPQLYGTQFDWDEFGNLSPQNYDDMDNVNNRRKAIGMNSLEEQTKIIRQQAIKENQETPLDFRKRKKEYETWRRKVGWLK